MMFTHKNLMTVCCAAVLAFGLAACGSSSSSDGKRAAPVTGENGPPEIPKTDAEILADALAERDAAQEAYDDLIAMGADADPEAVGPAFVRLQNAQTDVDDAADLPENITAQAEIMAQVMAIVRDAADNTISPIHVLDTNGPFAVGGGKVTQLPAPEEGETDAFAKSDAAPATIEDWDGAMYSNAVMDDPETGADESDVAVTTVVSYTDRAPNDEAEYSAYYVDGGAPPGHVMWRGVGGIGSDGELQLEGAVNDDSRPLFDFDHGLIIAGQIVTIDHDDPDTTDVTEIETEFEGSFHGIPGTYTCTGDCTIASATDSAALTTLVGTWTFTPDNAMTAMVADVIPDTDYIDFGYWLVTTPGADGTTYAAGTYAEGALVYGTIANVEGTAEYDGDATGVYMLKTFNGAGDPIPLEFGQFTAAVNLMAAFGGNNVAENEQFMITGNVDDFKDSAGDLIDDKWDAILMMNAAADGTIVDNIDTDGTFGGPTTGDGSYSGQFNGANTADANAFPGSASGIFDAHFDNGHVAGAFGAYLVEEDEM